VDDFTGDSDLSITITNEPVVWYFLESNYNYKVKSDDRNF